MDKCQTHGVTATLLWGGMTWYSSEHSHILIGSSVFEARYLDTAL